MSQAVTDYLLMLITFIGNDAKWEGHVTELDTCKLCVYINIQKDRRYTYNVTSWRFRKNHCCKGNATMRYLCIVELHVCRKCNNNECRTTMLLWQTYVAGNNKTYLGLQVKWPIFNQILSFRFS
jgi:hypothetical protein